MANANDTTRPQEPPSTDRPQPGGMNAGLRAYHEKRRKGEIHTEKPLDPREAAERYPTSKAKAIAAKCFDCCGYQRTEVRQCTALDCPLWIHRPWQRPEVNEEILTEFESEASSDRLRAVLGKHYPRLIAASGQGVRS